MVEERSVVTEEPYEGLKWSAPSRPFKKADPKFYSTIGILVVAVCLILVVAGQFALIAAVLAILFVSYVLSNVPPERVHHEITSRGVSFAGKVYLWEELKSFGFKHRGGYTLLLTNTKTAFPGQLIMILEKIDLEEVKQALEAHIPFEEKLSQKDFTEKFMSRASKILALDK
jgi:hypothetical protein